MLQLNAQACSYSSAMIQQTIKGVIFDLDGTLVSSDLDFQLIKAQVGCSPEQDLLDFIAQLPSPYMRQEAMNIVHQHEMLDAQNAQLLPGVADSIKRLEQMQIPMAIVTRNFGRAAKLKLEQCNLPISLILTRDDAPAKPNPSALLHIAKQWQFSTPHCMYVGDYLYDIQAAHNAKMRSCLYAPNDMPHYASQAHHILRHFQELPELVKAFA
ncbi:HAD family hydrolase [Pseudoalteromonas sp. S16_S37]|uniref:HAD family hydrolase n=1 Tax=Pseudoalteromonas sp. S16_S37 TaxID=2720228 RepID=UPI00406C51B9